MPGIGKTTSSSVSHDSCSATPTKEAVLELNASDERGIDVVRKPHKGLRTEEGHTTQAGRKSSS